MSAPLLSIVMAVMDDFEGAYFTVQALRMYHLTPDTPVEIVIVDNHPDSTHGEMTRGLCINAAAKYIPMTEVMGTSATRNKAIESAAGKFAMCIDPHILFIPGAIKKVIDDIGDNILKDDIYSGPMLHDSFVNVSTHFNNVWRSEMLGVWGLAWQCGCKKGVHFSLIEDEQNGKTVTKAINMIDGKTPVTSCFACKRPIPVFEWPQHEARYSTAGFFPMGLSANDPPFEIPGQGLGCFLVKKETWPGFNKDATGFGGEEICIHSLYRQMGHKAICLPYLQWMHRFGRPNGVPYPLKVYERIRNYVLWYKQLGWPVDNDLADHFLNSGKITQQEWDYLISDPVANKVSPMEGSVNPGCGSCPQPELDKMQTIEDAYNYVKAQPRDFNEHMDTVRALVIEAEGMVVSEFTIRKESTIAFLAAGATVHSYSTENTTPIIDKFKGTNLHIHTPTFDDPTTIPESDILFLNSRHTGAQVTKELANAPRVSSYIVLHNTAIFGERGEDAQPGIMHALQTFLRANPEWSVKSHNANQFGLTILSRLAKDKPPGPGLATKAFNFAKAVADHLATGAGKANPELYETRLNICATCPLRLDTTCGMCGCNLEIKASWAEQACPAAKW